MGIWQDFRFAVRLLAKDRGFTVVAVIALGLGIAVNTSVFTFVNAVLLRGLPYSEPERIVSLGTQHKDRGESGVSYPDFLDWRREAKSFAALGAFTSGSMNVSDAGHPPERTGGAWVTANTFRLLGQPLLLGRDFLEGEDQPGTEGVAILGHSLWKTRYGSDPAIVGKVIRINEEPCTVVGVMPEGVRFPFDADMWRPLMRTEAREKRDSRELEVFGRLRPDVSLSQARTELAGIAARLQRAHPDTNSDVTATLVTYNDRFNGGPIKLVFLALMVAVGFVLVIACANVANLQLARSMRRAREIAVRLAVGASRWRIVRQLLIESVLVGVASGAIGLLLAAGGIRVFDAAVANTGKPYWIHFTMDARVFAFLAFVCVATGILFGLAPALQTTRGSFVEVLQDGGRGETGGRRAHRWRSTMVVVELVLTTALLAGAGLMGRSFLALYRAESGLRTDNIVSARVLLAEKKYPTDGDWRSFVERLEERLASAPGIQSATFATAAPFNGGDSLPIEIEGRRPAPGQPQEGVTVLRVGGRYFSTLGVALRRGREFLAADGRSGSEVAIINERLAAKFFPGEDPIGQRIRLERADEMRSGAPRDAAGNWITVVGISPSIRQGHIDRQETDPVVYLPFRQSPRPFMSLIARGTDLRALTSRLRAEVQAIDADLPLYNVRTLDEILAQARWPYRVFGATFAILALIALVLSTVGIFAVTSYAVAERTHEIGVRMTLGAQRGQVSWLILQRGVRQLAVGLAIGVPLALGVGFALRSIVARTSPYDPVTLAAIVGLLTVVTVTACLIPAGRATKVDPVKALRA